MYARMVLSIQATLISKVIVEIIRGRGCLLDLRPNDSTINITDLMRF